MTAKSIRNFSIIAHIDHGKSTLADRMLELTGTIEKRKMKEQVLDSMELERERGITIKMQPVRMEYEHEGQPYILNLIDTPGHIDFSYEVSRALKAVEGVLLLVDATQGVQAQTLSVLDMARAENLVIIPVINKIDLPSAKVEETRLEVAKLLGVAPELIMAVSGKTGAGVNDLLQAIIRRVPAPVAEYGDQNNPRALVFDFEYSKHRGVVVYVRVIDGALTKGDILIFAGSGEKFGILEVGVFMPTKISAPEIRAGEIGYIVTGIKEAGGAKVGDTLVLPQNGLPVVPGYKLASPVVWASIYPESQDDFTQLRQSLERLRLEDASLSFEEESSGALGRGFRSGFLGMLHMEIITERLKREFNLNLVIATPTISYEIKNTTTGGLEAIYSPHLFPEDLKNKEVLETWVKVQLILPVNYLNSLMAILYDHEAEITDMDNFGDNRTNLSLAMPLRELMRNFFDEVKSVTSGYASFSYNIVGVKPADVVRLDVLINEEVMPAFSRVVARRRVELEAEDVADKLKKLLPRQLIIIKIQTKAMGRIIASRTISAIRKDVTDYLYGGDITRKMKLREKQKKGKKKMQKIGKVNIPQEVFLKMMKSTE
ncbi:MAG: elongation factor 4 [Candidatus Vogelbacteria bacterium RIFOXYD1_FULL_44_32]|uniref:Elongation factor 4 n=1 Tax=Candidatus Vogelbacteria bacterium RIFOXYD1_FULL_44_32 TaxID=1802438 RepID=A0A1G2QD32_9BACT|nr:MAG: elongation factor 4 [Candidatus Vogelbacteria bacterium RIFOXYD1_FULL_44_32]